MANRCLGIFLNDNGKETHIIDLSYFNFMFRSNIKEAIIFAVHTVLKRADANSIIDVEINVGDTNCYCIGTISNYSSVLIITLENKPHNHLINLSRIILKNNKLLDSIQENYDLIKGDQKLKMIHEEVNNTKSIMYDNIDKILDRGEKLDVLIKKSEELSNSTKKMWDQSKKLNRCCVLL